MKINKTLLFSIAVFAGGPVWAALSDDIRTDSENVAKWFSQEVAHATAFNAAANPQIPGEVHNLLGVEVGLSAGVSSTKLDSDGFNNLPLKELETSGFDMPSDVLMAMPLVHAKLGLPFKLDVGVKYGHIRYDDTNEDAKSKVTNSVFGVDVRRRLMGEGVTGVVLPDVALSLAYDQANGDVTRTEQYVGPVTGGTLDASSTMESKWQTGAVTARVVASKQVLIFTPYIGAGYSRLMGDAETTVNITETGSSLGVGSVSAKGSAKADDDILQILGGVEFTFFPLFKINVGGLYATDDWAATAGLRFTFR
jgi:hypothetical protein